MNIDNGELKDHFEDWEMDQRYSSVFDDEYDPRQVHSTNHKIHTEGVSSQPNMYVACTSNKLRIGDMYNQVLCPLIYLIVIKNHVALVVRAVTFLSHHCPSLTMSLSLNCCILGDAQIFTVKIDKTENFSILQKRIKKEKASLLNDVDASTLEVWQVDTPVDDNFTDTFGNFEPEGPPLSGVKRLSNLFQNPPKDEHLHIVVRNPGKPAASYHFHVNFWLP